jgi:hypothetical protein
MPSKNFRVILWSMQAVVAAVGCAPNTSSVNPSPAIASRSTANALADSLMTWPVHSTERPRPAIVTPRGFVASPPPSDAIVLFNGTDLSQWTIAGKPGTPAGWMVRSGYAEVVAGSGNIQTVRSFGDFQLHIEWATPNPPSGEDQERGNSGVYLMKTYEIQILDSYGNITYADGQAASVFGEYPPLVNASLPPGEWQSYDIVFHRPRFAADKTLITPARATVVHNGILVQDNVTLTGPTSGAARNPYHYHPDRMPLELQDHGFPVRFRNIWVRDLEAAH